MSKPAQFLAAERDHPELIEAYERFAAAAHDAGPLSQRERRLVKLAVAFAAGMEGASHSHARQALEAGIGREELRHVAILTATTTGFPGMMRALGWIGDVTENV